MKKILVILFLSVCCCGILDSFAQEKPTIGLMAGINYTYLHEISPEEPSCLGCGSSSTTLLNKHNGFGVDLIFFERISVSKIVDLSLGFGLTYKKSAIDYHYESVGPVHTMDTLEVRDHIFQNGSVTYQSILGSISPAVDLFIFRLPNLYLHAGFIFDLPMIKNFSNNAYNQEYLVIPYLPDSSGPIYPIVDSVFSATEEIRGNGGAYLSGGLGYDFNKDSNFPMRLEVCYQYGLTRGREAYDLSFKQNAITLRFGIDF